MRDLLWLGLLLMACGCNEQWGTPPPDGSRRECRSCNAAASGEALTRDASGERLGAFPPETVAVWRVRRGPESGCWTHDQLTPNYIGTESKDAGRMREIMGMQAPAPNPWRRPQPAPSENAFRNPSVNLTGKNAPAHRDCRNPACPQCQGRLEAHAGADRDGFGESGPGWRRSEYYGLTPEQEALLAKAKKKAAAKSSKW